MTDEHRADAADPEAPSESGSVPPASAHRDPTVARRRPRALRIPDDEVARPQASHQETISRSASPVAPAAPTDVALTPTRIITINSEASAPARAQKRVGAAARGRLVTKQAGSV